MCFVFGEGCDKTRMSAQPQVVDHYQVLAISRNADYETIKKQYQRLVLKVWRQLAVFAHSPCAHEPQILVVAVSSRQASGAK
jgi:hypothetical protein